MEDEYLRYAHSEGHTFVSYDDTGEHIITGGTDGDIRIWHGFDDDDPESHHIGGPISSFSVKNKKIYVSSADYSVSSYTFPEIEFDEIIAQFNSDVYHITCSKTGNMIACGGGDFIIKVYETSQQLLSEFRGHKGPILSLCFDPKGEYLASSACDGTVCLWSLSTQECEKTLQLFKKSNDIHSSTTLCRLDWSPDGKFLAIPVDKEVRFYQRKVWECEFSLSDECIKQVISVVSYSPFGEYIAACATNGQMLVWNIETKKCTSRKMHEKEFCISGFQWNPSGKELAYCDMKGQLGIYSNPFSSLTVEAFSDVSEHDPVSSGDFNNIQDNENTENNEFDIGAIKAAHEPKIFGGVDDDDDVLKDVPVSSENEPKVQVLEAPKAPVQTSFQPSSAPIHLERRFMLWNAVGIVRCYNTEEENSIDVEFHDANVYHPLHINNTRNHTLASLSSEALLLACPKMDGNSSKLECLNFSAWDSNKEWVVEVPENEEIEAIALGEGFAVCVTDKRIVRIFTISGVQSEIFLIPGHVVCCTASNYQLLIAYHKGTGVRDDQYLSLMIVKVKLGGSSFIKECFLPLAPKAFLSWLGYSDEGNPSFVDTSGIVSVLSASGGVKWLPVADTQSSAKSKSTTYFVVGLSEIKQEIRYILCKGSRYPSLLPRPTVSVLPFSLPLCETLTDRGKLEEENMRLSLSLQCLESLAKDGFDLDSELEKASKKHLDIFLRLFALSVLSNRECRALSAAELMPARSAALPLAIRYATQRHRIALADRLGALMRRNEEDAEEEEEEDPYEPLVSRVAPSHKLRLAIEEEESVLKPKPMSRLKSVVDKLSDIPQESSSPNNSMSPSPSTSSLAKSVLSNPFKASPKTLAKKEESINISGIDDILNNSMKNVGSRNSSPSEKVQPKKFSFPKRKSATTKPSENSGEEKKAGFELFLDENRAKMKADSPDLSEAEIIKMAMKAFKEMSKEEKQRYRPGFSGGAEASSGLKENRTSNGESAGKRSGNGPDDGDEPKAKKIKSGDAVRKLTQFAFTKTPK